MHSRFMKAAFVGFALATSACGGVESQVPVVPGDSLPPPPPGQQGTWSAGAPMLEARSEFGIALFRNRIYVAGGIGAGGSVSERVFRYDPAGDSWERLADLPQPRSAMPLVVVGDTMYGVGGLLQVGIRTPNLWAYIPSTDTWEDRAELPELIVKGGAVELGGDLVLAGGSNGTDPVFDLVDSIAIYSPSSDTWRRGPPILTPRTALSVASSNGLLYALHGINSNGGSPLADLFDPGINQWVPLADAQTARLETASSVLNGRVHVFGGFDRAFATIIRHEVYDPVANSWDAFPNLPTERNAAGAATFNGAIYVIGGQRQSGVATDVVEIFRLNP